jgi:hypothetical protein
MRTSLANSLIVSPSASSVKLGFWKGEGDIEPGLNPSADDLFEIPKPVDGLRIPPIADYGTFTFLCAIIILAVYGIMSFFMKVGERPLDRSNEPLNYGLHTVSTAL